MNVVEGAKKQGPSTYRIDLLYSILYFLKSVQYEIEGSIQYDGISLSSDSNQKQCLTHLMLYNIHVAIVIDDGTANSV